MEFRCRAVGVASDLAAGGQRGSAGCRSVARSGRLTSVETRLRIVAGSLSAQATLDGSRTARAVWDALPIEAGAQTWGDEIYFKIPIALPEDDAREVVGLGDLGYWPPGQALCIFFGRTPASRGDEIRPASAVNVFGRVDGDPTVFKGVRAGTRVRLERVEAGQQVAAHGAAKSGSVRRSGQ